jgi:hypothetical protein
MPKPSLHSAHAVAAALVMCYLMQLCSLAAVREQSNNATSSQISTPCKPVIAITYGAYVCIRMLHRRTASTDLDHGPRSGRLDSTAPSLVVSPESATLMAQPSHLPRAPVPLSGAIDRVRCKTQIPKKGIVC